ncbi:MAG: hypothetical protein U0289_06080 [Cyclobacteriaceae bacterium]|nr:UDP-3-O-(3-hydroxymyristoyl)glucosamine N-acyltransferase [Cytophagales bacterium]
MKRITLDQVIQLFPQGKFMGNTSAHIDGVIGIGEAQGIEAAGKASWVNDKNAPGIAPVSLHLGLLILSPKAYEYLKTSLTNFLIVDNPRAVFFQMVNELFRPERKTGIETTAVVHHSATIGNNVYIGHHVVIEENCVVGDNTSILHHTVLLAGTQIGKDCIIGCHNTIGNYGFGYEKDETGDYEVLQHLGRVIIHDRVEIHNNTCIDRGVLTDTVIHENVKIDNLVHIAHGVVIERNSLIIANALIGGSTRIGENSWIAPSVSVINKVTVGKNTMTGIGAVIVKNTEENLTYIGNPAIRMDEYKKWSEVRKKLLG